MTIDERFERILDYLLHNRIVPFIGAGISREAKVPDDSDFKPTIEHLRQLLNAEICRCFDHDPSQFIEEVYGNCGRKSFDRLAEFAEDLLGEFGKVLDVIQISKFSRLTPVAAHYALACLALEGLVDEIISTNWDCCIEAAMKELTGVEDSKENSSIRVITDVEFYRRHGARRITKENKTILKFYKINGCAKQASKNIIITERQLQDFGQRSWARDLLKDRARSRTILFSGFGSDDPQVRHTVLQLLDEFSTCPNNKSSETESEHGLFMIAYDETLSFNQWQIVRWFCKNAELESSGEKVRSHVVTGKDAGFFRSHTKSRLPADDFWCALLEAALYRLIKDRYAREGSEFYTWLTTLHNAPDLTCQQFLNWLFPDPREGSNSSAFKCGVQGLFGPSASGQGFLLSHWLRIMDGRPEEKAENSGDRVPAYRVLREESLYPLATLFMLYLLARFAQASEGGENETISLLGLTKNIREDFGLGLHLGQEDPPVFLVSRTTPEQDVIIGSSMNVSRSRIRFEIAVPNRLSPRVETRFSVKTKSNGHKLFLGVTLRIDAEDFARVSLTAKNFNLSHLIAGLGNKRSRARSQARLTRLN